MPMRSRLDRLGPRTPPLPGRLLSALIAIVACAMHSPFAAAELSAKAIAQLRTKAESGAPFDYFVSLPAKYAFEPDRRFPVIIYLHGAGEVAPDPARMLKWDVPARVDPEGGPSQMPFVAMFPQRQEMLVAPGVVDSFVDYAVSHYRIDPQRIYMVGFSAGAAQVLSYVNTYPQRLAAGISISGFWPSGNGVGQTGFAATASVCPILATPIWHFHSRDDDKVPHSALSSLLAKFAACSAGKNTPVRWTEFGSGGHGIDIGVLSGALQGTGETPGVVFEPDVYSWLLRFRRD